MNSRFTSFGCLLLAVVLTACGGGGGGGSNPPPSGLSTGPLACAGGSAGSFTCSGLDLSRRVPFSAMGGNAGNDIWGWYDEENAREYALVGMTNGTAFVDVTNPESPVALGMLPTQTFGSVWRDIKVYRDHAFIVADNAGAHGMQVFDLTRLRGAVGGGSFSADFVYDQVGSTHNIAINELSGFAYLVGTDTCAGGLHMVDISVPQSPVFAGCHAYDHTHDTQCVTYRGPDMDHSGREICFSANENHVEIVDVTDKQATATLSTLQYPSTGYVHQGWLSEDQRHFVVGDEADELNFGFGTRTIVLDVADLDAPAFAFDHVSPNASTDHNLYVRGNRLYEGNYTSGLRVFDIDSLAAGAISEIAWFDTYPLSDAPGYDGVWSVYPFLPSGNLLVNDDANGLFILRPAMPSVFASAPTTAMEGDVVTFSGVLAGGAVSASWIQTAGAPAVIESPSLLTTNVTLPDIVEPEWLSFDLVADNGGSIDSVHVLVEAAIEISAMDIGDAALRQCVDDAAAAASITEANALTTLTCENVNDIAGLEAFVNLRTLALSGSSLANPAALAAFSSLEILDIGGYASIPCEALQALKESIDPAVVLTTSAVCRVSVIADLGGAGFDSALDRPRRSVYISVPSRQEIVAASLDTGQITDRIAVPGTPSGIDLSEDGTRLFVAMFQTDSILELEIDTGMQRSIPLNGETGHATTYDVIEAAADRLFVTANPGSGGLAYVAQVRLDQADAVSRVADGQIIRARPRLAFSPGDSFVYVGTGFSPNSLYRLSLADELAGIVLEDDHGSVGGTDRLAIDATGARIALGSGQVLRTGSFIEEGRIPAGSPTVAESGDRFLVNGSGNAIEFFDALTLEPVATQTVQCDLDGPADLLHSFDDDASFVLIDGAMLCTAFSADPTAVSDPYPELHFTDLAFEACVRATAQARGWTAPEEFTSLDCSANADPILEVGQLDQFVNLTSLDLSGSAITDITAVASLGNLSVFSARNTAFALLAELDSLGSLSALDVTGNARVSCLALDELAAEGVFVEADQCVDLRSLELGGIGFDLEIDATDSVAYVSVPSRRAILEVDLETFTVLRTLTSAGTPHGIALSQDESTLYAALNGSGAVAYFDLGTGIEEIIDIEPELGDPRTYDVAELAPGRILVSASPNSNGIAYLVEVRRDLANAAQRVANERIIRAEPEIAVAPDGTAVYVREGFSPASIYRLDATQATLPIVAEDEHGALGNTARPAISPDGSLLIARSGQLIATADIRVVGLFPPGLATFDAAGTSLLIAEPGGLGVAVYNIASRRQTGGQLWGCSFNADNRLRQRSDGEVIVLGDDLLCTVAARAW